MNDRGGTQMIDCQEAERRLHGFVDRELSDAQMAEVQRHLDVCENCRARFRFESGLRRLVRSAGQGEQAPESLRQRIRRLRRP